MQILNASSESILAPLAIVGSVVEKKSTVPILSHVLISKTGRRVSFTGSDQEMQITTTADVGVGLDEGSTTVNARTVLEIIRSLPAADVQLATGGKNGKRATIQAGKSRFSVQTLDPYDFPVMKVESAAADVRFAMKASALRHLLDMVHIAMAIGDLRYYLNGALLNIREKTVTAVATDGHRLALESVQIDAAVEPIKVILPRKTVLELMRLLPKGDEPVNVRLTGKQVTFDFANVQLISKVIEGNFPDYERVIPKANDKILRLQREPLLSAVERTAILVNEKFRGIRLSLAGGTVRLQAENAEQEDAHEELDVDYSGPALTIGFNEKYLREALANLSCEEVVLSFADEMTSALIEIPDNSTFKFIVMPVRL